MTNDTHLENMVKVKKEIATSVPPISLTLKKNVVKEEEVEEEELVATKPQISKNEVNVKVDCKQIILHI